MANRGNSQGHGWRKSIQAIIIGKYRANLIIFWFRSILKKIYFLSIFVYKGKNILNVHPPPKVSDSSILPLCISTNSFAILNPKP